jgi:hypothetical protein
MGCSSSPPPQSGQKTVIITLRDALRGRQGAPSVAPRSAPISGWTAEECIARRVRHSIAGKFLALFLQRMKGKCERKRGRAGYW